MGTFSTPKEQRTRNKKIAALAAWAVGAWVAAVALGWFTPAGQALVAVGLGVLMARGLTRFDATQQAVATGTQVRYAEMAFAGSTGLALVSLPAGPTLHHGLGGALTVAAVILGGRYLASKHQQWQPTGTWLGIVLDSWGRIPGRAPAVALLTGSVVLGGALNMYLPLATGLGIALAVVAGRPYWTKARGDAETRAAVSETLAGAMSGGAWTSLLLDMQRAPIWGLDLDDNGVPNRIVLPIPPGMAADAQPKVEDNIINRLAGWGNYSVQWHTGGPGGKRHAVIQWWPPLPDILPFENRRGDKRKVYLGVGKVNREMLATRPDAVVGSQEDVYLDFAEVPHALIVGTTGGGKSVVGKTVMLQWITAGNYLVICDPKRVGFNQYKGKRGVLKVATDRFAIRDTVVAAAAEMEARYALMEAKQGVDNIMSLPESERPTPLLVFIDELTEAMSVEKAKKGDEAAEAENDAAYEIRAAVSQIVRLGRAAGVHLLALTQRADVGDGIAGSTKNNLEYRILVGAADNTARLMAGFSESQVTATAGKKGRGIGGRVNTPPIETQYAYISDEDLVRFLAEHDLADDAVVYGDEGVSVLDAYTAAAGEAERLEILRQAIDAGDLTDADAKALGFESVTDVQELLAAYDVRLAESEKDAAEEMVLAQVRKAGGVPRKKGDEEGGTGTPGTPASNGPKDDLERTRRHTGKRVEPLLPGLAEAALESLIGLDLTKRQIADLRAQIVMAIKRAEAGVGDGTVEVPHLVLDGPPGTGKTTVARIIGSILRDLGVLPSGHVIEMTPKDVKAPYIGQSGPMADSACDDAEGGVLFIDEAYGLTRDQFAVEAMEQIMVRAENDRGKFVVILAGYPKEMDDLLDVNPGMRSRFETRIHFPAYTREELVTIAEAMISDSQRVLATDARDALVDLMAAQDLDARDWGNARSVRNLVAAAKRANDKRLTAEMAQGVEPTLAQMVTLTREDILAAGTGNWGTESSEESDEPPVRSEDGDALDATGGLYDLPGVEPPETPVTPPASIDDWFREMGGEVA